MNKTAIKNFAIWARNRLIADMKYRAGLLGITETGIADALPQSTGTTEFYDIGTAEPYAIDREEIRQRNALVQALRKKEEDSDYATAYKYIIEEVAYTWFNRLIAVRFMEVNDYLPSHVRVLSSETGKTEPDLVTNPFDAELDFDSAEEEKIIMLKRDNKIDEVFRLLFIKQCNALNEILPALFEKTSDYTELLLNLSVVDQDGVVYHLVHNIPEEDFDISAGGQVEIIGWLYQYYNTEPKNDAFAKKGKITKEEIPAVTQLFTPDWIVRYMVENSLGRIWTEGHPNPELKDNWKYYLEEAEQEESVKVELDKIRQEYAQLKPENIKLIDPCMGSGHILVYAFDVFMQIYESAGWSAREAAQSILENNIYGLDIDDRAAQLSYFAVMMKARQYDRRIFTREIRPNVYAIQESNGINKEQLKYFGADLSASEKETAMNQITGLLHTFVDAKEYGSILNVENYDWDLLRRFVASTSAGSQITFETYGLDETEEQLKELIAIGEVMAQKYEVVVTNPPYAGTSNLSAKVNNFVKKYYSDSKADLFAVFIERCGEMLKKNGFQAMITQHAWMFLSSYEKLRAKLQRVNIVNMAHLGARAFEEIGGEVVQTTSFVLRNDLSRGYHGIYCRLVDATSQTEKEKMYLSKEDRYVAKQDNFAKIPGMPVAYWISKQVLNLFDGKRVSDIADAKSGMTTTDNTRFLRLWEEVNYSKIGFHYGNISETSDLKYKWYPFCKGGDFRRWAGNESFVVNWYNDGKEIRKAAEGATGGRLVNIDCALQECVVWTKISSSKISLRIKKQGTFFSDAAPGIFTDGQRLYYLLGLLNTKFANEIIKLINPTLNFVPGAIASVPIKSSSRQDEIIDIVQNNVKHSRDDWNSFETSWDFIRHPMVPSLQDLQEQLSSQFVSSRMEKFGLISWHFEKWQQECEERFNQLKANEEELNRIFIDIYDLQDELTPEVEDKDITVRKADLQRDIKSLLSYAVGCMFGRYSTYKDGLMYAGGEWNLEDYKFAAYETSNPESYPKDVYSSQWFMPDEDNVIPITDEEYLEDDIVSRLCEWLKAVYGVGTLEENLDFIAKALGGKGSTSREIIRNYFLNDFFKDHCATYSVTGSGKRPIYWLFDSGKQNGFKALVYLHRYNADTIGNVRVEYLYRMQRVYEAEIGRMQDTIDHSSNNREVSLATKRKEKLQKQLKECREYDEKIGHLALSRIELDLDDGVKVNYRKVQTASDGKFYEILADSKNIMAKK